MKLTSPLSSFQRLNIGPLINPSVESYCCSSSCLYCYFVQPLNLFSVIYMCSCFHINQWSRLCHTRMMSYIDCTTSNTPRGQPTLNWFSLRWSWFDESTHYRYQVYLHTGNACCPRDSGTLTTSRGSRDSSRRTANRFTVPPIGVALSRATTSSWLFPFRSTPLTCTHMHRAEWI